MKRKLPVIFLSLMIGACSTMPNEIDDKYLAEKTDPQTKTIYTMEQKIIDKNREKQDLEKKINEQAKIPSGTEEEIKLLKNENGLLKDQVYFYEKNKDAVNLELKKAQLSDNESKLAKKIAVFEYQQSEKKLFETDLELKNAELAQYIAELNFEKSKIAAEYRDKNETPEPEKEGNFFTKLYNKLFNKKDPNDKYEYKQYSEYMETKKKDTAKADTSYKEALKKYQAAKINLDKIKQ